MCTMRFLSAFVLLVTMLGIPPSSALAQGGPPGASCGTFEEAAQDLTLIAYIFEDEGYASFRADLGLDRVSDGDHERITDTEVCGKIVPQVEEDIGRSLHDPEYAVYRYGPYYALEIGGIDPPGMTGKGTTTRLFIFQVEGTKFLAAAMI